MYNVYRYTGATLIDSDGDGLADDYGSCFLPDLMVLQADDASDPPADEMHTYLITGENGVGEGGLGFATGPLERPNDNPCP